MSGELIADFEKHYSAGAVISASFSQPASGFTSVVLFGPSGSGKTTVLRCLAGLERPNRGFIRSADRIWFDADTGISLPPQARGIGFLFQEYALFPHLTVEENIGYSLRSTRRERSRRVRMLMEMFGLNSLEARYPHQLSGGQQQRVALARTVAPRPALLLLDEPLSSLDAPMRHQLRHELRSVLMELNTPTIVVTHDPLEAVALADRAVVMSDGRVRQTGTITDVFSRPADSEVARIVGIETIQPGTITEVRDGLAQVQVGTVTLTALAPDIKPGPVHVCIRGDEVTLERGEPPQTSARNRLAATIVSTDPEGPMLRVTLDCGFRLTALVTHSASRQLKLAADERVIALIKAPAIHLVRR